MLCAHITNVFLNIAVHLDTRDMLGWALMGISLVNILTNLVIVAHQSLRQIYLKRREKLHHKRNDEINRKKLANREYLVTNIPE